MLTIDFLKPEQFERLIPLVKKFAEKTGTPFYQHINEVSLSLLEPGVVTIVAQYSEDEAEKGMVAYICGYYLNSTDFMMSQVYSSDSKVTPIIGDFLEQHLVSLGMKRIVGLFRATPRVIEKYGFKVARYVVVKELK